MAASDNKAIGYLELNSTQWNDALAAAGEALVAFAAVLASYKVADFFKEGIEAAIKFGNEAYFAAQKLNGFDAGNLLLVQKALERSGESAQQATTNIEEFGRAGRPLEQLFKGGSGGFGQALTEAAKEYGTQAAVLSASAEKFAFVQQQLVDLGSKLQGFFLGMADKISGPLSALFAQIDKIDLVGIGEKFGGYIVDAINVIRGLIAQGDLFKVLSLGLKLGFEEAVNYLTGAINTALSTLLQGNLWSGLAQVAVGALAIIGTFLTNVILGIGKLLVATVEAAFERLRSKYDTFLKIVSPAYAILEATGHGVPHASQDVGENLANIENNSLIQSQEKGAEAIMSKSFDAAVAGIKKLGNIKLEFAPGKTYDTAETEKQFNEAILKAYLAGSAAPLVPGDKTPTFSGTADPFHVIADSLAKVGGGGRYVRTGLSIAEKAAVDQVRYSKESLAVQKGIEKNTAKNKPATVGGG